MKHINDRLTANDNDSALQIDMHQDITPLHVLAMNPHAAPEYRNTS